MENDQIKLIEALASLLETKPFDEIAAKDVAQTAGVPVARFGYWYHDMYALLFALFESEERALDATGIKPESAGEAFVLSVSFALRHPDAARNVCRSLASGVYKRHVAALATKYFSDAVLQRLGAKEATDHERDAVRFLRAAAVGLSSKELLGAADVKEEVERYADFFDKIY